MSVVGQCAALLALAATPAGALLVSLEDPVPANALAQIETRTGTIYPYGMFTWRVDGVPQLARQWFWYRIGIPAEQNLGDLPHPPSPPIRDTNANSFDDELEVQYSDVDGLLLTIVMRLRGGGVGSFESSIAETIRVTNLQPFPVNVSFFQYTDLDVNGFGGDDNVEISGGAHEIARHGDAAITVTQTISGVFPSHFEVDLIDGLNDLLPRLGDLSATTLADLPGPIPGNGSYAYQWDLNLGPSGSAGETATFYVLKELAPTAVAVVPSGGPLLPLALALGLLLAGSHRLARRSRRA